MKAIEFEHASKKFVVRHNAVGSFHASLIDRLRGTWVAEDFWALRDVSMTVERGETLGLIGANGSGKSTALKLMAHILEPSDGRVRINGSVAGLLELGTGFHPELTGRENVYLFGSFYGLSRRQMDRQYDAIADFSDLGDHINQPVKHYSSGMYIRLAFSAAISLHTDILLLDEIFAVGDERFQRKCFDAMMEAQRRGTTIVFVSHSLDLVAKVCHRAIWLSDGRLVENGESRDVSTHYLTRSHKLDDEAAVAKQEEPVEATGGDEAPTPAPEPATAANRWGSGEARIDAVRFVQPDGTDATSFVTGDAFGIELHYSCTQRVEQPNFGVAIYDAWNVHITGPNTQFARVDIPAIDGTGVVTMTVPRLPLLEGTYQVSVALYDMTGQHAYDHQDRAFTFHVHSSEVGERFGLIHLGPTWCHTPATVVHDRATALLPRPVQPVH